MSAMGPAGCQPFGSWPPRSYLRPMEAVRRIRLVKRTQVPRPRSACAQDGWQARHATGLASSRENTKSRRLVDTRTSLPAVSSAQTGRAIAHARRSSPAIRTGWRPIPDGPLRPPGRAAVAGRAAIGRTAASPGSQRAGWRWAAVGAGRDDSPGRGSRSRSGGRWSPVPARSRRSRGDWRR